MKMINKLKTVLIIALLVLTTSLTTAISVSAEHTPAPPLPSEGLPAIPDYQPPLSLYPRARATMPAAYDSRNSGIISPVKNQDPWGTCWAFGAMASGEASLAKKGLASSTLDLSEMHLAYFFLNSTNDPLGLTANDRVTNNTSEKNYLNMGGNNIFTMFALSKWVGAADEATAPYSATPPKLSANLAYTDKVHLQNVRFVNTGDATSVKTLIQQYGAVSTAMYFDSRFLNANGAFYCPSNFGYYTSSGQYQPLSSNHVVTVVGWNDNYPKENFTVVYNGELMRPSRNGALIVKNSYGTDVGDHGYIYISYEDVSVRGSAGDYRSYAFDMEPATNYDHNYQYDGSFGSDYYTLSNGGSLSNVYTVKGNPSGNEKLEAVSFSLLSQNVKYSIQIYKDPPFNNPGAGIPMFSTPQTGTTTYSGYYTIPLHTQPVFKQGDSFAVAITFSTSNGSPVYCFMDSTTTISGIAFKSSAANGQSFYKTGKNWEDLNEWYTGATIRIKAFTSNTTQTVTAASNLTSTLAKPALNSLTSKSYNKTVLKWRAIKNAKGYEIYRSTSAKGIYSYLTTTSKLSYSDGGKATGKTYYYKIRAYRQINGKTLYSEYSSVRSVMVRPSTPAITTVKALGGQKITLGWKKIAGASGYEVYRGTSKKGGYKKIKTLKKGSALSYTDKAPKMQPYYYKVRAYRVVSGKKVFSPYSTAKKGIVT